MKDLRLHDTDETNKPRNYLHMQLPLFEEWQTDRQTADNDNVAS